MSDKINLLCLIPLVFFVYSCSAIETAPTEGFDCESPVLPPDAARISMDDVEGKAIATYMQQRDMYRAFNSAIESGKWRYYQIRSESQLAGYEIWIIDSEVWTNSLRGPDVEQWQLEPGEAALYSQTFCEMFRTDESSPIRWQFRPDDNYRENK